MKPPVKVLVVDDEACVRGLLKQLFELKGLGVTVASDGQQALEELKKGNFDWVFLDVRMPGMDGIEILKKMKQINPKAKFVMMTGYSVEDKLAEAKKIGIFTTIRKPFDLQELSQFIEQEFLGMDNQLLDVLVIDDDADIRQLFERILKTAKCNVTAVDTGQKALEQVQKKNFTIIFLDIRLSDINGLELYRKLLDINPNLKIILMTGYIEEMQKEVEKLKLRACLVKPFEINAVLEAIEEAKIK
ncbi:MAG: response regulator [Candidatus Omnitrophica bacterium]|nr:response regulator [Candidatus Omnitrophota bacterium]